MGPPARRLRPFLAPALIAFATLAGAPSAAADVGLVAVEPRDAAPGDRVSAWLGCGSCLAPSISQGPHGVPEPFPVSLVNVDRAPEPKRCDRHPACGLESTGPPKDHPYRYLGLAKPMFRKRDLAAWPCCGAPKYRLHFRVPAVRPGRYAFAIYCERCLPGPRGSLIVDTVDTDDGLRVRPHGVAATAEGEPDGPGAWVAGLGGIAAIALGAYLLVRRRANRSN